MPRQWVLSFCSITKYYRHSAPQTHAAFFLPSYSAAHICGAKQFCKNTVMYNDPFLMRKSHEVVALSEKCNDKSYMACWCDIKGCITPWHIVNFCCVEDCINKHSSVALQNSTRLSVQALKSFYLCT